MKTFRTVLEIYCDFAGCQGGTIHQALEAFRSWDIERRLHFCNLLEMARIDGVLIDRMGLARSFSVVLV